MYVIYVRKWIIEKDISNSLPNYSRKQVHSISGTSGTTIWWESLYVGDGYEVEVEWTKEIQL